MTTRMTQTLLLALLGYAAGLFVLSLAVHVAALVGVPPPGGNLLFFGLHFGVFTLVLALILLDRILPGTTDMKTDHWRLPVFPQCPAWMRVMARGLYVYAVVAFAFVCLTGLFSTGTATLSMSPFFR